MRSPILSPVIVLVLWTFVMWGWMYAVVSRPCASKAVYDPRRPSQEFHAQMPAEVRWKADNYNHLLEQPTIFYAVCLILAFVNAGAGFNATLAWAYVALRIVHSLVQATVNKVMIRFTFFVAASLVLLVTTICAASDYSSVGFISDRRPLPKPDVVEPGLNSLDNGTG